MNFIVNAGDSIQKAIDAAHENGGGRVVIEPGVHHSKTIFLKSFVELHLVRGAKIQGSSNPDDYDEIQDTGFDTAPEGTRKCLIAAVRAENIAITGSGEINGAGPDFFDTNVPAGEFFAKPPHPRPRMIQFFKCRNLLFEGVSFIDSPSWTFWLAACEDVNIRGIKITGCQQMITNDGIDIDGCCRVTVSDCLIRTSDDCIILRAMRKGPDYCACCEEVTVSNCILDSWCQGIRVGCPSDDTIRNCTFSNLVIHSRGNGIVFQNPTWYLRKGCTGYFDVRNILFTNILIECEKTPVRLFVADGIKLRYIGNITFSNLRIESDNPCEVEGSPETVIEDVRFSEVICKKPIQIKNARRISLNSVEVTDA